MAECHLSLVLMHHHHRHRHRHKIVPVLSRIIFHTKQMMQNGTRIVHTLMHVGVGVRGKKAHCLSRLEKSTRTTHMACYGQSCNLTTMMLPPSPPPPT